MSALLTVNKGDTDKIIKYIAECRTMGIEVLPPDINQSEMDFTVDGEAIRFGLAAVKNVGAAAVEAIVAARSSGPFASIEDFLSRVDGRKVNKKVVESLVKCGAFDFTGKDRNALLCSLGGERTEKSQGLLFGTLPAQAQEKTENFSARELLAFEKETLGFYITSHPLSGLARETQLYSTDSTETVKEKNTGEEAKLAVVCAALRETVTKKGGRMAFARCEDLHGSIEVVVFSDLYGAVESLLKSDVPLLLAGRVEKDAEDECKIIATAVTRLEDAEKIKNPKKTHILAPADSIESETFGALKETLRNSPGASPVFLHLVYPDNREVVVELPDEFRIEPTQMVIQKIKELIRGGEVRLK
jgi:DNA polymerase-3 subunit alpha